MDRHWVKCRSSREQGLVPKSNIHTVENIPNSLEPGHSLLVCGTDFKSEAAGDLSIFKRDLIIGLEAIDESWTKGLYLFYLILTNDGNTSDRNYFMNINGA